MDIHKFIQKEAGQNTEHDREYAEALLQAYELFKDKPKLALKLEQERARNRYRSGGATHRNTADCMIIMELLNES